MGVDTRSDGSLYNTEYKKVSVFKTKEAQTRKTPCEISHEDILNTLHTADEVH